MKSCLVLVAVAASLAAQPQDANYDEAKVLNYTLPDPLAMSSGEPVKDAATWEKRRRPEILKLFETQMYGKSPERPRDMSHEVMSNDANALGGTAIRRQIRVFFSREKNGPKMDMLLYLPKNAAGRVPVFLGLNFTGNHAVHSDPGILLNESWMRNTQDGAVANNRATEKTRGMSASRWQVEKVLERGYGVATIYYGDIDPDYDDGFQNGVHALYKKKPGPDEWGSIAAWAWGLSRALDVLESDRNVDAKRVFVHGHSRLGKAALWAGAVDTRFAMVISNDSGEGGAALARRRFGETTKRINTSFPHWFADNFLRYNDKEDTLPFDQHMLIALIAPRPVYVASAQEDQWADPKGEFLAAREAGPVYKLLGKDPLAAREMPAIHEPVMNTVGYHIRAGKHDVTEYDWQRFMDFADKHFGKPRR